MMSSTLTHASEIALSLPQNERAALAHALIQSLDQSVDFEVEQAWDQELASRLQRYQSGQSQSRDAFVVLDELKARYRA